MLEAIRPHEMNADQLASQIEGRLILPEDPEYDAARRVWNGVIERYPALIVRVATVADVIAAIRYAREHDLRLSIRGGGHNVAGHATNDGGLVIDLSLMDHVEVDPAQRSVRAGGGATIAQLDLATQAHGLAVPMGVVSATGIAGLTLGGGYGWLRNKYGLSSDNLIGATVVTANGEVVHAREDENFDLLWALRGGGGNFGVVTEFVYRAFPVGPEVTVAFVLHDAAGERAAEAIRFFRDYAESAPDEVSALLSLGIVPPHEELFPPEIHGRRFVLFAAVYAGPIDAGKAALNPLITFDGTEPLIDFSGVMPYLDLQTLFDADYPDGLRYYWKSLNLTRLDDAAIDVIVDHSRRQPSPLNTVDLWHVGGAVRRVGPEQGAFAGRHVAFLLNPEANWEDAAQDAANVAWVRNLLAAVQPFSDGSRYLNFAGFQEEADEMMQSAHREQYARLAQLKWQYDPHNLFSLNANIKPARP